MDVPEYNDISRIPLSLSINGEKIGNAEFIRYLSPITIKKIYEIIPFQNRINNYKDVFLYIKIDLEMGVEKGKTQFKKGEIAFSPSGSFLCIFLKDYNHNQKLNHVGNMTSENINVTRIKSGDSLRIENNV